MDKGFTNDAIPALGACESPIESKFVGAVFAVDGMNFLMYESGEGYPCKLAVSFERNGSVWSLQIQPSPAWLNGCRFDFSLIEAREIDICSGVHIELDGREFHLSEQRKDIDRQKDRISLAHGIPVIRFSGAEAFYNAPACAQQAMGIVTTLNGQKIKGRQAALGRGAA